MYAGFKTCSEQRPDHKLALYKDYRILKLNLHYYFTWSVKYYELWTHSSTALKCMCERNLWSILGHLQQYSWSRLTHISAPSASGLGRHAVMVLWYPIKRVAFLLLCRLLWYSVVDRTGCVGHAAMVLWHSKNPSWVVQRCWDPAQLMIRCLLLVSPHYTPAKHLAAVICPNFLLCLVVPAHNLSHIGVYNCSWHLHVAQCSVFSTSCFSYVWTL